MTVTQTMTPRAIKHLNCSSVSDECRSRAGRVFHEVGPDEQNARGPMEAVKHGSMKRSTSKSRGRRSRSHEAGNRFGGLAEASVFSFSFYSSLKFSSPAKAGIRPV